MKEKRLRKYIGKAWLTSVLLMLATVTPPVSADTTYQVEIIVFARDAADGEDSLRSSSELRYPVRTITLGGEGGAGPFQLLPAASLRLNREAGALAQRKNMRVLAHQAWLWPGEDAAHATPVAIGAGRQFGSHRELEGYIALSADHFLHIDTQLWLSRTGNQNGSGELLTLPRVPGTIVDASADNPAVSQIYLLRELRRMRSGELHYFDHSRLGMLVQITPVGAAQQ